MGIKSTLHKISKKFKLGEKHQESKFLRRRFLLALYKLKLAPPTVNLKSGEGVMIGLDYDAILKTWGPKV